MHNLPDFLSTRDAVPSREAGADIIDALYAAARDPRRWPDTLSHLAAHVGGASAMVASCDLDRGVSSVVASRDGSGRTEAAETPPEVWHVAREVARHAAGVSTGAGTGPAAVIRVAASGGADAGLAHLVLPHAVLCGDGRAGWISVAPRAARPSPPGQAMERFSSLRGHLTRALDIALELEHARDAGSSLAILLSALPCAALVLDDDGRIMQANSAARAILDDGDGVHQTGQRRLRATLPEEDQKLAPAVRTSMAASRDGGAANRLVVRVRRTAGTPPLLIILDPIPPRHHAPATGGSGLVLLRIIDGNNASGGRTYPLQAAFDLTAAEMRIAALIAAGLSPALTARRLDVSTNTVRTHLLRVFDKTGVRSQHALTLLLAAIGSWPVK